MKFIKQAKETWNNLKGQQQAYILQAVWYGKLVPGMSSKELRQAKGLMNTIKNKLGKFPGIMYEQIYSDIEDYKKFKINQNELLEKLYKFYPTQSRIGLKLTKEDKEFNLQMRLKLIQSTDETLEEVVADLKKSEERDKQKVLSTI